jgi:metallo-beta-lactamase family protein
VSEMSISFYGATNTVTGSCSLVSYGAEKILIDCGFVQGADQDEQRNQDPFPFSPTDLSAVILTHGHLDHSGRLPLLVDKGFKGPIYTHSASAALAQIVWHDTVRISARDENSLYGESALQKTIPLFVPQPYDEEFRVGEAKLRLLDAGHILGSAHVLIEHAGKRLIMSGDVGALDTPIIRDPTFRWDSAVDAVVIESTYGNRLHKGRPETIEEFREIIEQATSTKGVVLIPAFAIGRTQELLFYFNRLIAQQRLPRIPVILDSPMARQVTQVYRAHRECYDDETWELVNHGMTPLAFPGLREVSTWEESASLAQADGPMVIIAGAGMCTGGRIIRHLIAFLGRASTTVLFVGWQGKGTLGRRLVDGERQVSIQGRTVPVRARIATLNGFSAHADRAGLVHWAQCIPDRPHQWLINHGEPDASAGLMNALTQAGLTGAQVAQPEHSYEI